MFNIAGFHIPKHIAFKSGSTILEKIGWDHEGLKPLGNLSVIFSLKDQMKKTI